jgi:hypothetical protein
VRRISKVELGIALILSVVLVILRLAARDYIMAALIAAVAIWGAVWQIRHPSDPTSGQAKHDDDDETDDGE